MKKNFKVVDSIYLSYLSYEYDMHNCYDLTELSCNLSNRTIKVQFANTKKNHFISIVFFRYHHVMFSDKFFNSSVDIEEFGYKSIGDSNMDWLYEEKDAGSQDCFVIRLTNDEFFRIYSDQATLSVSEI